MNVVKPTIAQRLKGVLVRVAPPNRFGVEAERQ